MRKCLIIKVTGNVQTEAYKTAIQKSAQALNIEGTIQNQENGVLVYACGLSDNLDKFTDTFYSATDKSKIKDITTEPFVSEKGYRNVFRIIG
jgi:acylphosphatase